MPALKGTNGARPAGEPMRQKPACHLKVHVKTQIEIAMEVGASLVAPLAQVHEECCKIGTSAGLVEGVEQSEERSGAERGGDGINRSFGRRSVGP